MRTRAFFINLIQGLLSGVLYFVPLYADYVTVFIRPNAFNPVYFLFILIACMIGLVIQTWSGLLTSLLSGLFCTLVAVQFFVATSEPIIIEYYSPFTPTIAFLLGSVGIFAASILIYLIEGYRLERRPMMEDIKTDRLLD
ncbi:hypothetical protein [Exiguobacterium flavidum]|uniref:hypothetical protein n=1 Tax=Exiguobacterium flavidum TaxID=2184695 RepID=UPI000DF78EE8|nr:hypothetical protein [Exiguobacterium flavidum]